MCIPRAYTPSNLAGVQSVIISGKSAIHLIKVLRLRQGDAVNLFNGAKLECRSVISRIERHTSSYTAISKGDRMDGALQKGTELDVTRFTPMYSKRCAVKLDKTRC